ncbi:WhiB family transcriptional regulator [Nonomuraea sp. NPDC051941]|uniref:WhiB family transcriptional regulator n=1 Tax=Nonomuraea sp. NPDC051941 TaxID=3364373 RepID=UPI0037C97A4B
MTRAACRAADPELFFPVIYDGPCLPQVREAKAVCSGCPIRDACLHDTLRNRPADDGIWGGTTPDERLVLLRLGLPA